MIVRCFTIADQQMVRDIVLSGLGEHFGFVDRSLNPDLENIWNSYVLEGHAFIVAEHEGKLMGVAGMIISSNNTAQIVRVSVPKAYRRQGIASALVDHLVREARMRGVDTVWLETCINWQVAIALYQKNGFVEDCRDDENVYMRLHLS